MDVSDLKGLFAEVKKRMDGQLDHVRRELGGVRTGRASVTILDSVHVEAYGSHMPLTEERRRELSKLVHKYTEEGRNAVRQVRRDANDRLKKLLKDHKISEDDERRGLDEVQKITDQHIVLIDDLQKKKDGELLGK